MFCFVLFLPLLVDVQCKHYCYLIVFKTLSYYVTSYSRVTSSELGRDTPLKVSSIVSWTETFQFFHLPLPLFLKVRVCFWTYFLSSTNRDQVRSPTLFPHSSINVHQVPDHKIQSIKPTTRYPLSHDFTFKPLCLYTSYKTTKILPH